MPNDKRDCHAARFDCSQQHDRKNNPDKTASYHRNFEDNDSCSDKTGRKNSTCRNSTGGGPTPFFSQVQVS